MASQHSLSKTAVMYDAAGKEVDRDLEVIQYEDGTVGIGRGRYASSELTIDSESICHESGWKIMLKGIDESKPGQR